MPPMLGSVGKRKTAQATPMRVRYTPGTSNHTPPNSPPWTFDPPKLARKVARLRRRLRFVAAVQKCRKKLALLAWRDQVCLGAAPQVGQHVAGGRATKFKLGGASTGASNPTCSKPLATPLPDWREQCSAAEWQCLTTPLADWRRQCSAAEWRAEVGRQLACGQKAKKFKASQNGQ